MGFWIFMFIVSLLIPAALLLTWYLCPKLKTINNVSGYRSKRSMQNQNTWDFAQKYCSKISLYMFFPSLILAIGSIVIKGRRKIGSKALDFKSFLGFGVRGKSLSRLLYENLSTAPVRSRFRCFYIV